MRSPTPTRSPLILRWFIALLNAKNGIRYGLPTAIVLLVLLFLSSSHSDYLLQQTKINHSHNQIIVSDELFILSYECSNKCVIKENIIAREYKGVVLNIPACDTGGSSDVYDCSYDISLKIQESNTEQCRYIKEYSEYYRLCSDSSSDREIRSAFRLSQDIQVNPERIKINQNVIDYIKNVYHPKNTGWLDSIEPKSTRITTNTFDVDGIIIRYTENTFHGESHGIYAKILNKLTQTQDWFTDPAGLRQAIQNISTAESIAGQVAPSNLAQIATLFRQDAPKYLTSNLYCGGIEVTPKDTQRQLYTNQTRAAFYWIMRPVEEGHQSCVLTLSFEGTPLNGSDPASIQLFADTLPVNVQVRPVIYGSSITLYSTLYAILAFICGGSITWAAPRFAEWLQQLPQRWRKDQRRGQAGTVPKTGITPQRGRKNLRRC